jgi:hypothetical protein
MKKNEIDKFLKDIEKKQLGDPDPNYILDDSENFKPIFYRHEINIADYLMGLRESLIKDYMKGFETLEDAIKAQGENVLRKNTDPRFGNYEHELIRKVSENESISSEENWKTTGISYNFEKLGITWKINPIRGLTRYPTAFNLIKKLGDACPIANYSSLAPNTVLHRHTGPENRSGEYIRIHIPLIIPKGDIFFEVNGEEITWDDLFGFDNQYVHSAHNYTNEYRLIFLLDVKRSFIGLPPGQIWNKNKQLLAKPFVRKNKK